MAGEGPTSSMAALARTRADWVKTFSTANRWVSTGPSAAWDGSHKGKPLDLTGYTKTFEDNFESLSTITDGATGSGPWYAPARPDTSLAHFLSPSQTPVTFSIDTPGVLTITMQKVDTSWYSGHIQTVNNVGDGFAQRYGYFEARMAFEKAVSWPAFWLYTPQDRRGSGSGTR